MALKYAFFATSTRLYHTEVLQLLFYFLVMQTVTMISACVAY